MKKKVVIISCIVVFLLLAVLFVPYHMGTYDDGGTTEYTALTYKIVKWNRITIAIDDNGNAVSDSFKKTSVYWFSDKNKSIDELYKEEMNNR